MKTQAQALATLLLLLTPYTNSIAAAPDVYVVPAIGSVPILPNTFPVPGTGLREIRVTACRGEFEPASFVLRAGATKISNLEISWTNLRGSQGTIPASYIDLRVVAAWYQGGTAGKDIKADPKPVLVPELLLHDDSMIVPDHQTKTNLVKISRNAQSRYVSGEHLAGYGKRRADIDAEAFPLQDLSRLSPVSIEARSNKQFWITVRVPSLSRTGTYRGTITGRDEKGTVFTIALTVEVPRFDLRPSRHEYSIYYRGQLHRGTPVLSSDKKTPRQMAAELKNMREHGITNPTMYQDPNDTELLQNALKLYRDAGLTTSRLYYLGLLVGTQTDPAALRAAEVKALRLRDLAQRLGLSDIHLYAIDEADGRAVREQLPVWQHFRRLGFKVFVAGRKTLYDLAGGELDVLIAAHSPDKQQAQLWHKSGGRILLYADPQVGVEDPALYRRNFGIRLWQSEYDGAMNYAYQDGFGSIWNDFDSEKYRDHAFTYPTIDGVIDTIQWEGFREAVDDVRYLVTLEDFVSRATSRNTCGAQTKTAESLLAALSADAKVSGFTFRTSVIEALNALSPCITE